MDLIYYNSTGKVLYEKNIYDYLTNTFKAFTDAIIPRSPELAQQYGRVQITVHWICTQVNSLFYLLTAWRFLWHCPWRRL